VKIPLEVSLPLHFAVLSLQSVPIPAVSFQGCSPEDCAPFCAPPASKSVALGSNGKGKQITRTSAENQHHSKLSHSVGKMYAATVNRRVASSNLARGAKSFEFKHFVQDAYVGMIQRTVVSPRGLQKSQSAES
jgi:hypothetical protein